MAYEMFTILLVDDNKVTLMVYDKYLSSHHYRVVTAKDGNDALEKAFLERPDVILLDIMMPGLNGYDVCTKLREAPATADIPIIMLTALDNTSARQKATEIGADDFISKTENLENLDGRIKTMLKKRIQAHTHSWLADLPGNIAADYAIRSYMETGKRLGVIFLDIKGLNAYSKSLGYKESENILWQMAHILDDVIKERGKGEFVGYLGQDRFIILSDPGSSKPLVETIVKNFETKIQNNLQHLAGQSEFLTLAIGAMMIEKGKQVPPGQIYDVGQMLVNKAKTLPGNSIQVIQFK